MYTYMYICKSLYIYNIERETYSYVCVCLVLSLCVYCLLVCLLLGYLAAKRKENKSKQTKRHVSRFVRGLLRFIIVTICYKKTRKQRKHFSRFVAVCYKRQENKENKKTCFAVCSRLVTICYKKTRKQRKQIKTCFAVCSRLICGLCAERRASSFLAGDQWIDAYLSLEIVLYNA